MDVRVFQIIFKNVTLQQMTFIWNLFLSIAVAIQPRACSWKMMHTCSVHYFILLSIGMFITTFISSDCCMGWPLMYSMRTYKLPSSLGPGTPTMGYVHEILNWWFWTVHASSKGTRIRPHLLCQKRRRWRCATLRFWKNQSLWTIF